MTVHLHCWHYTMHELVIYTERFHMLPDLNHKQCIGRWPVSPNAITFVPLEFTLTSAMDASPMRYDPDATTASSGVICKARSSQYSRGPSSATITTVSRLFSGGWKNCRNAPFKEAWVQGCGSLYAVGVMVMHFRRGFRDVALGLGFGFGP